MYSQTYKLLFILSLILKWSGLWSYNFGKNRTFNVIFSKKSKYKIITFIFTLFVVFLSFFALFTNKSDDIILFIPGYISKISYYIYFFVFYLTFYVKQTKIVNIFQKILYLEHLLYNTNVRKPNFQKTTKYMIALIIYDFVGFIILVFANLMREIEFSEYSLLSNLCFMTTFYIENIFKYILMVFALIPRELIDTELIYIQQFDEIFDVFIKIKKQLEDIVQLPILLKFIHYIFEAVAVLYNTYIIEWIPDYYWIFATFFLWFINIFISIGLTIFSLSCFDVEVSL